MATAPAIRRLVRETAVLSALAAPVGAAAGAASALFLGMLGAATCAQQAHPWLLFLLPLAGLAVVGLYQAWGAGAERGTDLILEQAQASACAVPRRMTPLVLAGTVISQLFGASVGREGTAVQMGGGLAAAFVRLGGPAARHPGAMLVAGMAGGFGSVFGTPLAGAVFAAEVLVIGRLQWRWLTPALVASFVADRVCLALGARHATYAIASPAMATDLALLGKVAAASLAFGLAARTYVGVSRGMGEALRRLAPSPYARVLVGSAALIGLVLATGGRDYLGLGVASPDPGAVTLASAFAPGGATAWSWWWKLLFTALCLAAGFRGGEVTPLFFIGATLGNALAGPLGAPVDLLAGLGLAAVFAGAANAPLACVVLGIELFGPAHALPLALSCLVACVASGRSGIYAAQRRPS